MRQALVNENNDLCNEICVAAEKYSRISRQAASSAALPR
jgi:hypothetical protein